MVPTASPEGSTKADTSETPTGTLSILPFPLLFQGPGDNGGKGKIRAALWQNASNWLSAARNSPPGTFPVPGLGSDVRFQGVPQGKLYKGDPVVQALIPHIPDLLKNAEVVWLEGPKRNDSSYHSVARLVSRAVTGDGPVDMWMVIRRNAQGDWHYNHQYTRVRPVCFKK